MKYADKLDGRLLIYYGTADNNVHPTNAMQLIQALQRAGKSFEVQVGPDAGPLGRQPAADDGVLHREPGHRSAEAGGRRRLGESGDTFHAARTSDMERVPVDAYSSPAFFISLPAPAATSFTNASTFDGFVVLLWPAQISLFCFRE